MKKMVNLMKSGVHRVCRLSGPAFLAGYVLWDEIALSLSLGIRFSVLKLFIALGTGALLCTIGTLCPGRKLAYGVQSAVCTCVSLLYLSQGLYWSIFQTPYYLKSVAGLGKAMAFADIVLSAATTHPVLLVLFAAQLIVLFTGYRTWFLARNHRLFRVPGALAAVWLYALALCLALSDGQGTASPRAQLVNGFLPKASVQTFGFLPAMVLDVKYNLLHWNTMDAEAQTAPTPPARVVETPLGQNQLEIDFDTAESDETLRAMNEFFRARVPTQKNEYTGLFQGKNLILFTCEGFSDALIDPERTPTLYRLFSEGFRFRNFYTPVWGVSTSDGEFVATTGLLPKTGVWSYTEIAENAMPFALGTQFSRQGSAALAFHGHDYTYYNRDRSYPAMGYDYYGQGGGLQLTDQWPESDVEMVEQSLPFFIHQKSFHVYYMTISGHLGYTFAGNRMATKHRSQVEDLPYCEEVQAYLACQMELEDALTLLLEELEKAGQLENTVIALSADHYPYGLTNEQYAQLRGKGHLEEPFELYENGFLIWTPGMEPVDVDVCCSSLDILPTLSNLFGLPYDSRLMMGTDVFSGVSPMVLFADHSLITDDFCYDAASGKITSLSDRPVTQERVDACIQDMEQRFFYSAKIIETDYYGYLIRTGRVKE